MHIIRPAHHDDLDILLKLAKTVHFINLPADKDIIAEKISRSRASFRSALLAEPFVSGTGDRSAVKNSPLFMFVLADAETNTCHGTSMIVAKMGQPGSPNVSFELRRREFFSQDLQVGSTHITAKLYLDESGPSEIGGLIVGPSLRRHPEKLGKQIALIRFHFMGLFPEQFSDHILAEMMAPITPDGRNTFWEHLGRKFINLPYAEADRFCQYSREFMTSLLPREEIYLSLLPAEARQGVAQVGRDTVPARKMLEALGFKYTNRIDPFDGGPHLECDTRDITLVRDTARAVYQGTCPASQAKRAGFVSVTTDEGDFIAVHAPYAQTTGAKGGVRLPREYADALRLAPGAPVGITPLDLHAPMAPEPGPKSKPAAAPTRRRRPAEV
ncbi:MAG TPA: arginine N-succinyltransferase [Phycisphaerales bacterium]|nr:arginine N-succinyltransferase [Phycisphaerales bacterium]